MNTLAFIHGGGFAGPFIILIVIAAIILGGAFVSTPKLPPERREDLERRIRNLEDRK